MDILTPLAENNSMGSNSTKEEIEFYNERQEMLVNLLLYQGIINNPLLLFSSLYVVYKVFFVRQRREIFLVVTPILFCIQSGWWFYDSLGQLLWDLDYQKWIIVGDFTNGLYALSHWIFAAQYFRTSLLLPQMFQQSLLKVQMRLFELN